MINISCKQTAAMGWKSATALGYCIKRNRRIMFPCKSLEIHEEEMTNGCKIQKH